MFVGNLFPCCFLAPVVPHPWVLFMWVICPSTYWFRVFYLCTIFLCKKYYLQLMNH